MIDDLDRSFSIFDTHVNVATAHHTFGDCTELTGHPLVPRLLRDLVDRWIVERRSDSDELTSHAGSGIGGEGTRLTELVTKVTNVAADRSGSLHLTTCEFELQRDTEFSPGSSNLGVAQTGTPSLRIAEQELLLDTESRCTYRE